MKKMTKGAGKMGEIIYEDEWQVVVLTSTKVTKKIT